MQRFLAIYTFLVLTAEADFTFEKLWSTEWRIFWKILYWPPGPGPWVADFIIFGSILFAMGKKASRQRARPLDSAIWLSLATFVVWIALGISRSGNSSLVRLQLHAIIMMFIASFAFAMNFRKAEDFALLGKAIVYAALFRFSMAVIFYFHVMRKLWIFVACPLDHGDTLLFATAIVIMVSHAFHTKDKGFIKKALFVLGAMLWSIQINNRRLAWIAVIGSFIIMYAMLSNWSTTRRRLHRTITIIVPTLVLYVAVGWGSDARIFKPLKAFQSMGPESSDSSTESRNLENLGLVKSLRYAPIGGFGFGHQYVEVTNRLAPVDVFPQYRYVPHNSVLGLMAFAGGLGFTGIWLSFVVGAYLAARSYRFARTPLERTISVTALCEVFIHTNQMYGDIGINATQGMVLMPIAFAAASRMSLITGAWPQGGSKPKKQEPPSIASNG